MMWFQDNRVILWILRPAGQNDSLASRLNEKELFRHDPPGLQGMRIATILYRVRRPFPVLIQAPAQAMRT
ncbi:MAG: hypothetical protein DRH37_00605 [Deltaproteobacteria bacterium]|nr:MAG: hypothetical protein DRH37_00605 [Deltaproteobacteria bacterium]